VQTHQVTLETESSRASIALVGAEPVAWSVSGHDLLWSGDPEHWSYHAPILFPVVGASRDGVVQIDGGAFPMPQHGFARTSRFTIVDAGAERTRLRLSSAPETRERYPFEFQLDVSIALAPQTLTVTFEVTNTGAQELPYAIGFHPAFPWPLDGRSREEHRVVFEKPEDPQVPVIAPGGLIGRRTRRVPLQGRELVLDPALFTEALCFLNARSRSLRFVAPSGAGIEMGVENFPHLAVWTKPTAPFLSLEAWSGHAEPEDFSGELRERPSTSLLPAGQTVRHAVVMRAHLAAT
jgi:galactose mutarotase-like enzyme